ncbi:NAD(P)/FAD-dependent oxidoreductase [Paenibacillus sp. FSL W8-0439]|uniref:flavin monoamine oxidase family protein n=1 Tax=Paenibacillus sp. FSL W8-0439 TaxID=2921716 RepID=UPI0030F6D86D
MKNNFNKNEPVIVIGAGLGGLRAATLLHEQGINCIILEARDRIGGRVLSLGVEGKPELGKFDLGPTWYWPRYEYAMDRLVKELNLQTFEQFTDGKMLVERSRTETPIQHVLPAGAMEYSLRFVGGVQVLIDALVAKLPTEAIHLNTMVTAIHQEGDGKVKVQTNGKEFHASSVIVALPPRIIEQNISFLPKLHPKLHSNLLNKPTWMGGQAKIVVVYDTPFWRDQGLSGFVSSRVGPLQEIHDASPPSGSGALFGFFGLPAKVRLNTGKEQISELVMKQLTHLFGPSAKHVKGILYKDWSSDEHTAVEKDSEPLLDFPNYGPIIDKTDTLQNIFYAGTEMASQQGGHLEGAVQSAERVVNEIIKRHNQ